MAAQLYAAVPPALLPNISLSSNVFLAGAKPLFLDSNQGAKVPLLGLTDFIQRVKALARIADLDEGAPVPNAREAAPEARAIMQQSLMDPIAYTPDTPGPVTVSLGRTSSSAPSPLRTAALRCALVGSMFSLLFMGIATNRIFNLSAEDAAFGNGCGGSPPSMEALPMLAALVNVDSMRAIRDNATGTPSDSSTYKSKGDGAACASTDECIGVCSGFSGGTGRCMLSEYGGDEYSLGRSIQYWTMADGAADRPARARARRPR